MESPGNVTVRALRDLALLAGAGLAAASLWAASIPRDEPCMVDAQTWQDAVAAAATGDWPQDGWYRLVPRERAVDVRAVTPADRSLVPSDALFLRLPGATLKQGARPAYRYASGLKHPRLGQDYALTLGATQFSLRVENGAKGMEYAIGYGGQSYSYALGPFDASSTAVRLVADLDGDALPDFVVEVGDATYLLLSTRALPGPNLPTAELWARGDDGC
ncbi:MAG: hypothetical protein JWQ76_3469 [Ramlibacter sp.]|nr:hypothetical protein [Ramlibacter sp.]